MRIDENKALLLDMLQRPGNYSKFNHAQHNYIKLFGHDTDKSFVKTDNTWTEYETVQNFISTFVGGNGSGKTFVLAHIAGTLIGVIDNKYFKDSNGELYPFYKYPPAGGRGRIISNTRNIRENIVPMLKRIFPQGTYKCEKRGQEFESYWEGPRGRAFDIMTYNQDVEEFRGVTLGWAIFDEPENKPDIFKETTARFRRGGEIGFTLTPLGEAAWVYDLVIGNSNWEVGTVYSKIWANSIAEGGVLTEEDINRMIAGWDESEMNARAHAQFMHLEGLVYPTFNRSVHVVDPAEIPQEGTIYCAMDPHQERPPAIIWAKACSDGRLYIIREWPEPQTKFTDHHRRKTYKVYFDQLKHDTRTIDDYCRIIKQIESEIGVATKRVMDGRFGNQKYPNSGRRVYEEYNIRGVSFELAGSDPTLARKHSKVKLLLDHDIEGIRGTVRHPRILFSQECENNIRSMERYIWKWDKAEHKEIIDETHKDFPDCIGMIADREEFRYRDPAFTDAWHGAFESKAPGTWAEGLC